MIESKGQSSGVVVHPSVGGIGRPAASDRFTNTPAVFQRYVLRKQDPKNALVSRLSSFPGNIRVTRTRLGLLSLSHATHARKPSVRAPHAANTSNRTNDARPRRPARSHKLWSNARKGNTARFPLRCTRRARTSHHVQTAVECREAGARAASTPRSAARSRGSSNDAPPLIGPELGSGGAPGCVTRHAPAMASVNL